MRRTEQNESVSAPGLTSGWTVTVSGFDSGTYALVHQPIRATPLVPVAVPGYARPGQVETFRIGDLPALAGRPLAVDDAATRTGIPVAINVLANDSDPDDDPLTITEVTDPLHGTAVNNGDGTVTYRSDCVTQPPGPFTGTDTFAYTVDDGGGGTATEVVSVRVKDVEARSTGVLKKHVVRILRSWWAGWD